MNEAELFRALEIDAKELEGIANQCVDCTGTVMLSDVTEGKDDCRSCDTFLFDRVHTEGAGCAERLSALTVLREFHSMGAAVDFDEQLKKIISSNSPESQTVTDGQGYTIVSWPSPTVNQTARYDLERSGDHIRARLLIFRAEITPKPPSSETGRAPMERPSSRLRRPPGAP